MGKAESSDGEARSVGIRDEMGMNRVVNIEILQVLQYLLQYFFAVNSDVAIRFSSSIDFDIAVLLGCIPDEV